MTGSKQLGGSLIELEPGAVSYPFHFHCANEEAIFVISGKGTARIGDRRVSVQAGDWIAFPVGPEHAHQMVNDGDSLLVYLAIGTDHKCEVVGYPDSKKVAAFGGESWENPWVRELKRSGETLDYWDGEPEA
ncbi:MAG: cupin domain-containing protein [Kofleriaceae bacterium]